MNQLIFLHLSKVMVKSKMKYIKVQWIHLPQEGPENPVLLYSELDSNNWEVRKVEVFEDGGLQYANESTQTGSTGLGLMPVPTLDEINAQNSFDGIEIPKEEFEEVWNRAVASSKQ